MPQTKSVARKSIETPDEVREFPMGRLELVDVDGYEFGRAVFEPGWRWSECVKPIAGTESCEFRHHNFVESGSLHVRMDDGTEIDLVAGDVAVIAPGHDAWVTSDEPCIVLDFGGDDRDYAKPSN